MRNLSIEMILLLEPGVHGILPLDFLLKLHESVKQSLRSGRASRDVNIDRNNTIASPDNRVGIMVVAAAVGATAHADNPPGLRHLIVDFPQSGCHFVGKRACDNHAVGLPRGRTEQKTEAIEVVTRGACLHHFHGAACKPEGHRPEGVVACPIDEVI